MCCGSWGARLSLKNLKVEGLELNRHFGPRGVGGLGQSLRYNRIKDVEFGAKS